MSWNARHHSGAQRGRDAQHQVAHLSFSLQDLLDHSLTLCNGDAEEKSKLPLKLPALRALEGDEGLGLRLLAFALEAGQ